MAEAAVVDVGSQDISQQLENKRDVIKRAVAKKATQDEFEMFMHLAKTYQLDPFQKEIFFWKYKGDTTIMTSRDGYLKIANRHPEFDGLVSDVVHKNDNFQKTLEVVQHEYGTDRGGIVGAYALVYRKDRKYPIYIFAPYEEYSADKKAWKQYPSAMILKCAESMALKRAFSVSGLVSKEEMEVQEAPVRPAKQPYNQSKDITPPDVPEKASHHNNGNIIGDRTQNIDKPKDVVVPSGKYEGKTVEEAPDYFLNWVMENMKDNEKWSEVYTAATMYLENKEEQEEQSKEQKEQSNKTTRGKVDEKRKENQLSEREKELKEIIDGDPAKKRELYNALEMNGAEKVDELDKNNYELLLETLEEVDEALDPDDFDTPF